MSSYADNSWEIRKTKIDDIKGLAPSIAIQQKVISSNPRSTVGTSTEIYDYLKLLLPELENVLSISGEEVQKDSVTDVIDYIEKMKEKRFFESATSI